MKDDDGWKKIIDLLKKHYSKDDNTTALKHGKSSGILPEDQIRVLISIYHDSVMINAKSE